MAKSGHWSENICKDGSADSAIGSCNERDGAKYRRVYKSAFSRARDITHDAVERQLTAMGAELFEVGALQRGEGNKPQFMLLRTWDRKSLIESIPWLRYQNWHESHIFVRPKGKSNLTLIDDLKITAVAQMRQEGFQPAVVVQTSPGSYQVWIKHTSFWTGS